MHCGGVRLRALALGLTFSVLAAADPVTVHHQQGLIHGFLVLRDMEGRALASGDLLQTTKGNRVTAELIFHFKDGSLHEETALYAQRSTYQLLTYHLIQKGPSFKHAIDLSLNVGKGLVTVHDKDEDGKEKTISDRLKLPPDLVNGMLPTLIMDVDPDSPKTTVSMLIATPKPVIVKLEITPAGEDSFYLDGIERKAFCYKFKIDIGGIAGLIAPFIGKQPPDGRIWIIGGKAPGFLKLETVLYEGGPLWQIGLASPTWHEAR